MSRFTMSIPKTLGAHTDYEPLAEKINGRHYGDDIDLSARDLTDEMLAAVRDAAEGAGEKGLMRMADAIIAARAGDTSKPIPRLHAAPEMVLAYLRENLADGWVYKRNNAGHLEAWLVTEVEVVSSRSDDREYLSMGLIANGRVGNRDKGAIGTTKSTVSWDASEVTRKRVSAMLEGAGVYVETPALREEYDAALADYIEILGKGFSEQYRFNGTPVETDSYRTSRNERTGRKVIHDVHSSEVSAPSEYADSALFLPTGVESKRDFDGDAVGPVPTHFDLRVFDLSSHDFIWVDTRDLVRYEYDPSLRDKIVLPDDQRNLLDILTTNLGDFTGDVIEGKTIGNVVLAKGKPGVGKTLTAEVYSELIERPLYSIHSGNLGTGAVQVRKNLEVTFQRAKRWNAVLLLDEADVFVLERGDNIEQNAIVAEFLRTLEYFDGLMFMTTNRADNIDDAILSRAAAIIDYKVPDVHGIRAVWHVQAKNQNATIDPAVLDDLVYGFKVIAPRDVKMLLRLALRYAKGNGVPLSTEVFAKCAMFRGLHFEEGSRLDEETRA